MHNIHFNLILKAITYNRYVYVPVVPKCFTFISFILSLLNLHLRVQIYLGNLSTQSRAPGSHASRDYANQQMTSAILTTWLDQFPWNQWPRSDIGHQPFWRSIMLCPVQEHYHLLMELLDAWGPIKPLFN